LLRELKTISAPEECKQLSEKVDVQIAKANPMGYGLYEKYMVPLKDYLQEIEE